MNEKSSAIAHKNCQDCRDVTCHACGEPAAENKLCTGCTAEREAVYCPSTLIWDEKREQQKLNSLIREIRRECPSWQLAEEIDQARAMFLLRKQEVLA